jgi:photosystem II stability/assembly factor-like uncharacterized protein
MEQNAPPWRAIGPSNISGRTLAIALNPQNPNTIYAGSASGGLWCSYSAGVGERAWEYVRTGFPVLGVAAIAVAPDDSNTIYIGTGEVYGSPESFPGVAVRTTRGSYGIGILKSTDAGRTWSKSLDWFFDQRRGVQKIRIDPTDANSVWAATTEGTFKTTDAGANWVQVLDVVMATDIAIHPQNSDTLFVACGGMASRGHGIYRTLDGGVNWQELNLGPDGPETFNGKAMLAIAQSSPNVVFASIGESNGDLRFSSEHDTWLCKSVDFGETWRVVSTEKYASIQGWYSHDVAVNPINADEVWTAGITIYPWISREGGVNLQFADPPNMFVPATGVRTNTYPHLNFWADYHEIVFHPTDPSIIYFANDGGVFRTTDGGLTSENCNGGYQTTQFYNGTSSSLSDSLFFIGGMQDNLSGAYQGSTAWTRIGNSDGGWTGIDEGGGALYVSAQNAQIYKHPEGIGSDLEAIWPSSGVVGANFVTPFVLSPVDNQTLYLGSQVVHRSDDGGQSWSITNNGQALDGNPVLSLAASYQSTDVVYAATTPNGLRGHVFRTDDGGEFWVDITADLPDRFPTDLAVDPNSDQNIFITFGGFGSSHAFKSSDGGETWIDVGVGLPDVPTWAVTVDPLFPDHIYVGNALSVYLTADGGDGWQEYSEGLPDAIIAMDLSVSRRNRALRVATHGNGVFERKLFGTESGDEPIAQDFRLRQNYPNPFNASTTIEYFLPEATEVLLKVYNINGQEITTLVRTSEAAGLKRIVWDGTDASGRLVSSGVYIYRLQAGGFVESRQMILLK